MHSYRKHSSLVRNIIFIVIAVYVLYDLIYRSLRIFPVLKRVREIKEVERDPNTERVTAEIISIETKKLSKFDTQYDLKLYYESGGRKCYKDIVLINKQAARVGQKVNLICKRDDPYMAAVEEGGFVIGTDTEKKILKRHIGSIIIDFAAVVVYLIYYMIMLD